MEVSGESSSPLFGQLVLRDARAVGAGLPGLPGPCHGELLPPSPSGRAATVVALAHYTLGRPCFPRQGVLTVSSALDSER